MRIVICGPSTCGKDTAASFIARHSDLRFSGSVSQYLIREFAEAHNLDPDTVYAESRRNDQLRKSLFDFGAERCRENPGHYAEQVFAESDILCGVRDLDTILWLLREDKADLIIWIDRDQADDPTIGFGRGVCDVVIANDGIIEDFEFKLLRLMKALGILKVNGRS